MTPVSFTINSALIVPSFGSAAPANISYRSCREVRREPAGAADCTDYNTSVSFARSRSALILYHHFILLFIIFPTRSLPPAAIIGIRKDVGTFRKRDGLRPRTPAVSGRSQHSRLPPESYEILLWWYSRVSAVSPRLCCAVSKGPFHPHPPGWKINARSRLLWLMIIRA
ncbi:hypothetical protein BJ912DRAFT_609014 [Pholiota molesta]|nr:hypothetical protein BJ912DRAFT_609014 [Pholiota molesta]